MIESGYMKNPAQAIDFNNFDRLRFKSNIVKNDKIDIYRIVGDIFILTIWSPARGSERPVH